MKLKITKGVIINMRNINRILKICKELEELWLKYPDLRLGQLILNVFSFKGDSPLYFIEDEDLIQKLEEAYRTT